MRKLRDRKYILLKTRFSTSLYNKIKSRKKQLSKCKYDNYSGFNGK